MPPTDPDVAARVAAIRDRHRLGLGPLVKPHTLYAADVSFLLSALDAAEARAAAAETLNSQYRDLLAAIWLYIGWKSVTRELETEQKELFADAIDAHHAAHEDDDGYRVPRWWRPDAPIEEARR